MHLREIIKRFRLLLHLEKKRKRNRVYIANLETCFRRLNQAGVSYLVLRWFEDYPAFHRKKNKDVDFLVADRDVRLFFKVMETRAGRRIPCDVYSETGIDETSYFGMSYYPPHLAAQMLERRKLEKGMFYVPSDEDYFLSFVYHTVYHKNVLAGVSSGIEDGLAEIPVSRNPSRDFYGKLTGMVDEFNVAYQGNITLLGLHKYLRSCGWAMPKETISHWPIQTPWLMYLTGEQPKLNPQNGEIALFVIREFAKKHNLIDDIVATVRTRFEVLEIKELNEKEVTRTSKLVRGGNWGPGPGPVSGGPPAVALVCFDHQPCPIPSDWYEEILAKHPLIQNMNIMIKTEIRDRYNATQPRKKHCSFLHSADNEREAEEYIQVFFQDESDRILEKIAQVRAKYQLTRVTSSEDDLGRSGHA